MRKVSAVVCSLFVMVAALAVLALPAGAQAYPPSSTTPTSQAASNAASNLAFTGSDSTPLVIIGIIAVTLGAVLVVAARRRGSVQAPKAG